MSFNYNVKEFNGQKVQDFEKDKGITDTNIAYRIAWDWDSEEEITENLEVLFNDSKVSELKNIVIGSYGESDTSPAEAIRLFIEHKDKLQNLQGIFWGDITYEQNECSWIENDNFGMFLYAFPKLEVFRVRGGNSLGFSFLDHQNLKTLIIESGGLAKNIFEEISTANLPALEHLELWLGSEYYGFESSAKEVTMAYRGKDKKNHLPSLKYLGLRNSEIADKIAVEMINDPILKRIEILDYSKGIFANNGASAILNNPLMKNLKKIDLHHNFVSDKLAKELVVQFGNKIDLSEREALPDGVDTTSDDFDFYDYDMYIEVSE